MNCFFLISLLLSLAFVSANLLLVNTSVVGYGYDKFDCDYCCEKVNICNRKCTGKGSKRKCEYECNDICVKICHYDCYNVYAINLHENIGSSKNVCNLITFTKTENLQVALSLTEEDYPMNSTNLLYIDKRKNVCYTNSASYNSFHLINIVIIGIISMLLLM